MLKKILSVVLVLAFLAFLPVVSGCEKDEGDSISVTKKRNVENVTVDQRIKND